MFPPELEANSFRTANGEFGWTREQIPVVVDILRSKGMAILGGELWYRRKCYDGFIEMYQSIPQREDIPSQYWGIYVWSTDRKPEERWQDFVERGALETLSEVSRWPWPSGDDQPNKLPGQVFYNLTYVSEPEYKTLITKSG